MKNKKTIIILTVVVCFIVSIDIALIFCKQNKKVKSFKNRNLINELSCEKTETKEQIEIKRNIKYQNYDTTQAVYVKFTNVYQVTNDSFYPSILETTKELQGWECIEHKNELSVICKKRIVIDNEEKIRSSLEEDNFICSNKNN